MKIINLIKSWSPETKTKEEWEKIRSKQYKPLKEKAIQAGIEPRIYKTKGKKSKDKEEFDLPQDIRKERAIELANELGIPVPENVTLPDKVIKAKAKGKGKDTKVTEKATEEATDEVTEEVIPSTFVPKYPNVKLLDKDGNQISTDIDFTTQESIDKVESLVGKNVLFYKSQKHKALDPYSLPKKLEKWRFDGIDYDGKPIFTRPTKGAWKGGVTSRVVKDARDHLLYKSGKHTVDAELMFYHLFSGRGDSYSIKKPKGKFQKAVLTEGQESSAPQ